MDDKKLENNVGSELPDLNDIQTLMGKHLSSVTKPCSLHRKRKRSDMVVPAKKLKTIGFEPTSMGSLQSLSTNVPFGMQWENNSCAYDKGLQD